MREGELVAGRGRARLQAEHLPKILEGQRSLALGQVDAPGEKTGVQIGRVLLQDHRGGPTGLLEVPLDEGELAEPSPGRQVVGCRVGDLLQSAPGLVTSSQEHIEVSQPYPGRGADWSDLGGELVLDLGSGCVASGNV